MSADNVIHFPTPPGAPGPVDEGLPGGPPAPSDRKLALTETGNAERFHEQWGGQVHYLKEAREWMLWDGRRWCVDGRGMVRRMAKATVRSIYAEAYTREKLEEREACSRWAFKSESQKARAAMLDLALAEPGVTQLVDAFDADPWLLNVENGVLRLQLVKGAVQHPFVLRHDPALRCRKLAPVTYDPEALCPTWEAFLRRVLGGDPALIRYVQKAVGYALTGSNAEQCLFLLYGHGRNGKTTFLETIGALLGDYGETAEFSTLVDRKNDGPRNDIARLAGARYVSASETGEGKRFDEALVKTLTGGEAILARFLHKELFRFVPQFKLFLAANHKPQVRGTDLGIWRRLRLVPFTVQIPAEEVDKSLPEKLRAELPGILAWAVAGCLLWQREGLEPPQAVVDATEEYRVESDVLGAWIADHCVVAPTLETSAGVLYANYVRWAQAGGEFVLSQTKFGKQLTERGFPVEKRGRDRERHKVRVGIGLTAEAVVGSATGGGGRTGDLPFGIP